MKLHSAVTDNKQTLEYGAYVRIDDDTRFPPVSSTHPGSPFPHYAVLTKNIDMLPGLSIPLMNDNSQIYIQKYGYNSNLDSIDAGHEQTIWTGTGAYPWSVLDTGVSLIVTSTSSTDTNTRVTVQGLDTQFNMQEQTIMCNGTSSVSLSGEWKRVFRAYVSGDTPSAGDIHVKTDSTIVAHVPVKEQQTLMALYTVPRGYTAYLTGFDSTVSRNEDILFRLRTREPGGVFRTQHVAQVYQAPYKYHYEVYKRIDEMVDIECTGDPTNNNVATHAAFDLILIKNS